MNETVIKRSKITFRVVIAVMTLAIVSCGRPFVKNAPKGQYYLYDNNIEITDDNLSIKEINTLQQRLFIQIEDSCKIKIKKKLIFFPVLNRPHVFDTLCSDMSVKNILGSLYHLGYYNAKVSYHTDTSRKKITVNYFVNPGKQTIIDSVVYDFTKPELKKMEASLLAESYLQKGNPISKVSVMTEINRIVDSFRNNGYYKFTAAEIKVIGDTTIDALKYIGDDPFEQLKLLAEAESKRETPKIKLTVKLNPFSDSSKFQQYFINKIYILPDYDIGDNFDDTTLHEEHTKDFIIKYHKPLFKQKLFKYICSLSSGELYRQADFNSTISNFSKTGVWQSVNIRVIEVKDSANLVNLVFEMIPSKKYSFEASIEASYSAASNTSNVLSGNLFGLSGNLTFINRNLGREAIRMTHNIRSGVELNNNRGSNEGFINSNEISYSNNTSFPRLILPQLPNLFNRKSNYNQGETFVNLGLSYNTRFNLFDLQSINAGFGWAGINHRNWKWTWTPYGFGFSNLLNQSDSFINILKENPFLKFSYNTAFVSGMGINFSKTFSNFKHPNSVSKELSARFSAEESGLTWGLLPIFQKFRRRYIKGDAELKYLIKYNKSSIALRSFLGIGVPLLGSDTNRTLPFFKQYFGGGSNSMRAWPVRGIGPGGRPIVPFSSTKTVFNDRTGDMQFEINGEYRFDIAEILQKTLVLRGAVFTDIGNVWNTRNTQLDGSTDTSQFQIKNFYRQIGVTAGTGFRLDFNYFVLRFDLGFRFKRPELYYINDGWKAPNIGFDDAVKKIFTRGENDIYRKWRYENFNFSIGIGYSF